jgi:hypothetical protein
MKNSWIDLPYHMLNFSDFKNPNSISSGWSLSRNDERLNLSVSNEGHLIVDSEIIQQDKVYLTNDSVKFSVPPVDAKSLKMEPNEHYEVSMNAKFSSKTMRIQLWIIEYGKEERIAHSKIVIKPGSNKLEFNSSPNTSCFKAALRLSGRGTVKLSPIRIRQYKYIQMISTTVFKSMKRSTFLGGFHEYLGENLVFIVGPPRSGTTWVLKLLQEHPDVIAATEENLNAKINIFATLETNIFNNNRPFTDNQIKRKFFMLAHKHPGKVIVEKRQFTCSSLTVFGAYSLKQQKFLLSVMVAIL